MLTGTYHTGRYIGMEGNEKLMRPFTRDYTGIDLAYRSQNTEMLRQILVCEFVEDSLYKVLSGEQFPVYQYDESGKLVEKSAVLRDSSMDSKNLNLEIEVDGYEPYYMALNLGVKFIPNEYSSSRPTSPMMKGIYSSVLEAVSRGALWDYVFNPGAKYSRLYVLTEMGKTITDVTSIAFDDPRDGESYGHVPPKAGLVTMSVSGCNFVIRVNIKRGKTPAGVVLSARKRFDKPLGIKAYGSIPHLPGSKVGVGDHTVSEGQARICTVQTRDRHDRVIVQEKLDGACTSVALVNGEIIPLQRNGSPAKDSPYEHLQLFHHWVKGNEPMFRTVLREGERLVGEWLAMTHGIPYDLPHGPWVVFDLMVGGQRLTVDDLSERVSAYFEMPSVLSHHNPLPVDKIMRLNRSFSGRGNHGAETKMEGAVYRVERKGAVDFLAKWVRPDMETGRYLPMNNEGKLTWNRWVIQ